MGQRVARTAIAVVNFAVDLVIILIVMVLLGFGAYSIWDTNQIYAVADAKVYETYKPSGGDDSPSFAELQVLNPDVLGWITIYGTGIDYPVVQGEDNDEYMNKSATGGFSLGGSLFLDYQNAADFTDYNTIIYGHHMAQSEMFGDIDLFEDQSYFDSHRYGDLYYGGKNHGLELFAMIDADAYDFTLYNSQVTDGASYLVYMKSIARYWRDESNVHASDHIVMLSTCADTATNGRYVLYGVIRDETYEDTFVEEQTIIQRTIATAGNEGSVPILYLVIAVIVVLLLLAVVLVARHLGKERAESGERRQGWRDLVRKTRYDEEPDDLDDWDDDY